MCEQAVDAADWESLAYFHRMLDKHLDLVERRLLKEETIAGAGTGARRDGAAGSLEAASLETATQVRQVQCRWWRRILAVWALPHAKSAVHRPSKTLNVSRRLQK
jgi:hypothetical protein